MGLHLLYICFVLTIKRENKHFELLYVYNVIHLRKCFVCQSPLVYFLLTSSCVVIVMHFCVSLVMYSEWYVQGIHALVVKLFLCMLVISDQMLPVL